MFVDFMEITNLVERFETWGNLAIAAENAPMQTKEGYDCNWCNSGCGGCASCGGDSSSPVKAGYGLKTIEAKAEYECQGCNSCNGCNGCD